ncbi:hypothetical protein [Hazenella coriacea]|uniref:Conjugative transposon protein TcpC n=1 Tax=Hazenella coriacea TaxID=1179467 RepID=A0A4R3LHG4_9BACL|nr:hypothetical protein [Hazenella coriacea]TCS96956.1 hypothetical protein EDD58_101603 [Hazenella coriacea]
MFNTNLPSDRRRLLLLVLFSFIVVGFLTKYVLLSLGWVDGSISESKPHPVVSDPSPVAPVEQNETLPPAELSAAQQVAEQFIQPYANQVNKSEWLSQLKSLMTDEFYETLKMEVELARPVQGVQSSQFQKITNKSCEAVGIKVDCLLETVVIEQVDNQQRPVEKVYQVILQKQGSDWLVEEVNLHASID